MTGLISLLLFGCVVRYGPEPEAAAATTSEGGVIVEPSRAQERPDYTALEADLLGLLEQDADVDADRRDRVHAAQELALSMRSPRANPDAAVEAYLRRVIEIESRSLSAEQAPLVGEGVATVPLIQEEELVVEALGEDTPAAEGEAKTEGEAETEAETEGEADTDAEAEGPSPEQAVTTARASLGEQDYLAAIEALQPHLGEDAPAELEDLYLEAVDGWVHSERERAGALFLTAREQPTGEKEPALKEVEGILQGLLDDYPQSSYTDAIERNLALVRKELK